MLIFFLQVQNVDLYVGDLPILSIGFEHGYLLSINMCFHSSLTICSCWFLSIFLIACAHERGDGSLHYFSQLLFQLPCTAKFWPGSSFWWSNIHAIQIVVHLLWQLVCSSAGAPTMGACLPCTVFVGLSRCCAFSSDFYPCNQNLLKYSLRSVKKYKSV